MPREIKTMLSYFFRGGGGRGTNRVYYGNVEMANAQIHSAKISEDHYFDYYGGSN